VPFMSGKTNESRSNNEYTLHEPLCNSSSSEPISSRRDKSPGLCLCYYEIECSTRVASPA
jgi:hypothetical protein